MTIEELNELFKQHKAEYLIEESYEEEMLEIEEKIFAELKKDYNLAKELCATCSLDFFLWFNVEINSFYEILLAHKRLELFNILKDHVISFHNDKANECLDRIENIVKDHMKKSNKWAKK